MTLAERIPSLDDAALIRLRDNARRLEAQPGRQQAEAALIIPMIEAEFAERLARKPVKAKRIAKPRLTAAAKAAAAEADEAETADA